MAVTGLGTVTGSGIGPGSLWNDVVSVRPRVRCLSFGSRNYLGVCIPDREALRHTCSDVARYDDFTWLGFLAAQEALFDAGWDTRPSSFTRAAVIIGTAFGGITTIEETYHGLFVAKRERTRPLTLPSAMSNSLAGIIATRYRMEGPNLTLSTACSSSAHAIGLGWQWISHGICDVVVAGGSDAPLVSGTYASWDALKVLAPLCDPPDVAVKPFDQQRRGLVLGEGASVIVLEAGHRAKLWSRPPLAFVRGYGASADAKHLTHPDANGMARAMEQCLISGSCSPSEVDYIHAHGTGTLSNDMAESAAIRHVFGTPSPPVSSSKPITGHTMGAAGSISVAVAILSLMHQTIPATANLRHIDPQCEGVHHVTEPLKSPIRRVMVNAFGFGGNNASILIEAVS
ncbi:Beta-ketoacyl synthase [Sulfobacillus acidophilus TPY]|nr:Beta-ketoacyl synthase [Sulfobacillus acidophilus TPY]